MSYKKQYQTPGLILAVLLLIFLAYGLIVFYLPHLLKFYSGTGKALPSSLKFTVMMIHVMRKGEILIIPLLILAFIAVLIWWIFSSTKLRQIKRQNDKENSDI